MPAKLSIDPRLFNPKFRFRAKEIALIHDCWEQGGSILLTGIRRTGKSEVLKAALHRLALAGHPVGHLDVQDYDSLARFYQDLLEILLRHAPITVRDRLGELVKGAAGLPDALACWIRGQISEVNVAEMLELKLNPPAEQLLRYWQPLVEELASAMAVHEDARTLPVIGIDELPFMLENLLRAGVETRELTIMLASLRKLRAAGLRLIVAGSISFENLLTLNDIPHTVLGGFSRQSIPPFSREEAAIYLREELAGSPAGEAAMIELALDTLPDCVPEFLWIAVPRLKGCKNRQASEEALHQEVLPAIRRSFLQQFEERLGKNYTIDELPCAERILDAIAEGAPDGSRIDGSKLPTGYQRVLLKLQYDNFIIDGTDFKWRFSLNLVRQWWRAQRGMA